MATVLPGPTRKQGIISAFKSLVSKAVNPVKKSLERCVECPRLGKCRECRRRDREIKKEELGKKTTKTVARELAIAVNEEGRGRPVISQELGAAAKKEKKKEKEEKDNYADDHLSVAAFRSRPRIQPPPPSSPNPTPPSESSSTMRGLPRTDTYQLSYSGPSVTAQRHRDEAAAAVRRRFSAQLPSPVDPRGLGPPSSPPPTGPLPPVPSRRASMMY